MNSRERFIATVERKPVDRPACWLGDPTPEAVPALCDYYHVDNIKELKKVCGDDFYAVEIPYKSPTCSAIFAAFDWYMNGSNVDTEHRTLTADGCFAQCEDLEDVEAVNFPWPDPELYIDPEECRRLVDEAPDDKVVMGMLWACHFQDTCAAFGMQTCLMNMVAEPEMVHYVDDHIVDFYLKALKIFLEATKGKVQAILIGDDVGSQRGLMISPALISEFVIPGAKKLIDLAHSYGVKVIASNHDFDATPEKDEIVRRLRMMQDYGADIPKMAVMPKSKQDVLTLLSATLEMSEQFADRPIITMSMAGTGVVSRLAGETFGSALTFGAATKASAPGQINVNELAQVLDIIHKSL